MKGFQQQGNVLFWELKHEKVSIEPWGRDSLMPLYLRGKAELPISK